MLPAYHLEERVESHPLRRAVAERWDELVAGNRHVEFFVFPYGDQVILKTLNPAPEEGPLKRMNDMDDRAFRVVCDICAALPFLTQPLQPLIVRPGRAPAPRRAGVSDLSVRPHRAVRGDGVRNAAAPTAGRRCAR